MDEPVQVGDCTEGKETGKGSPLIPSPTGLRGVDERTIKARLAPLPEVPSNKQFWPTSWGADFAWCGIHSLSFSLLSHSGCPLCIRDRRSLGTGAVKKKPRRVRGVR